MATIASTGKRRNFKESVWAVPNQAWFGADSSQVDIPPAALNGGYVTAVNAAGTGTVNMIGVDAQNRIVVPGGTLIQLTTITASGAVAPRVAANYVITKAGVAALTLAAPTAGTDDGQEILITSSTAFAHTLTATGLLQTGSASVNVATFAAFAGAGLTLVAYNGKWIVTAQVGVTFS